MTKSFLHHSFSPLGRDFSRRSFLRTASATALASGALGFHNLATTHASELKRKHKSMILLWMQGAPSQFETFSPKPDHENGGGTEAIRTSVPGIEIASTWTETAKAMNDIALIRSMTNKEGNHQRATYQMHTGYVPSGSVKHPSLGANIAHRIAPDDFDLPSIVSIGGGRLGGGTTGTGPGFLGVEYEPFRVAQAGELPQNVALPTSPDRFIRRRSLLSQLDGEFAKRGAAQTVKDHGDIYAKAADLVLSPELKAFDLANEPQSLKDRYGDTDFGRGCLLARRLVESGVTYVEVNLGNWDTHSDNSEECATLSGQCDPAFATLIADLKDRGLLDDTLIVWAGEFGRTPRINARAGRDHFPRAFNAALAGCGVQGGQVIGATSAGGDNVTDRPVTVPDLFHSVCKALEVDMHSETMSPLGRPMKIVEGGAPVNELFS
ncbi:DUF1501 domain-containing protein [Stratiformator vulcanicus]|uniref:DUF1501 domain-containing protein n=1 Tax=Stratiformator vulcanicus TaxID=2527980 RepID=A0A517QVT2_9PLAN|nr:DUF1501 domain-containing protein [Stratiformator vulcanicus]QDT35720.1 hypothetical protein Pan189_00730 [Stratiformator vulcanicus]